MWLIVQLFWAYPVVRPGKNPSHERFSLISRPATSTTSRKLAKYIGKRLNIILLYFKNLDFGEIAEKFLTIPIPTKLPFGLRLCDVCIVYTEYSHVCMILRSSMILKSESSFHTNIKFLPGVHRISLQRQIEDVVWVHILLSVLVAVLGRQLFVQGFGFI